MTWPYAIKKTFKILLTSLGKFFRSLRLLSKQTTTLMVIPHQDGHTWTLRLPLLVSLCLVIGLPLLLIGFISVPVQQVYLQEKIFSQEQELKQIYQTLGAFQAVSSQLSTTGSLMQRALDTGIDLFDEVPQHKQRAFDLPSTLPLAFELEELHKLQVLMQNSIEPMNQLSGLLRKYEQFILKVPTQWPLGSYRGFLTAGFGMNIHPISGEWYLHRGLDIAYSVGTPIVSAADGKVVTAKYGPTRGLHVFISHSYGFSTRYLHLSQISVKVGQEVQRGQRIGFLGSTGMSTGPHLHFEILLGNQFVDPMYYLIIDNEFLNRRT